MGTTNSSLSAKTTTATAAAARTTKMSSVTSQSSAIEHGGSRIKRNDKKRKKMNKDATAATPAATTPTRTVEVQGGAGGGGGGRRPAGLRSSFRLFRLKTDDSVRLLDCGSEEEEEEDKYDSDHVIMKSKNDKSKNNKDDDDDDGWDASHTFTSLEFGASSHDDDDNDDDDHHHHHLDESSRNGQSKSTPSSKVMSTLHSTASTFQGSVTDDDDDDDDDGDRDREDSSSSTETNVSFTEPDGQDNVHEQNQHDARMTLHERVRMRGNSYGHRHKDSGREGNETTLGITKEMKNKYRRRRRQPLHPDDDDDDVDDNIPASGKDIDDDSISISTSPSSINIHKQRQSSSSRLGNALHRRRSMKKITEHNDVNVLPSNDENGDNGDSVEEEALDYEPFIRKPVSLLSKIEEPMESTRILDNTAFAYTAVENSTKQEHDYEDDDSIICGGPERSDNGRLQVDANEEDLSQHFNKKPVSIRTKKEEQTAAITKDAAECNRADDTHVIQEYQVPLAGSDDEDSISAEQAYDDDEHHGNIYVGLERPGSNLLPVDANEEDPSQHFNKKPASIRTKMEEPIEATTSDVAEFNSAGETRELREYQVPLAGSDDDDSDDNESIASILRYLPPIPDLDTPTGRTKCRSMSMPQLSWTMQQEENEYLFGENHLESSDTVTDGEEEEASLASSSDLFESPSITSQNERLYRSMPSIKCSIDILGYDSIKRNRKSTTIVTKDSRRRGYGRLTTHKRNILKNLERLEPDRTKLAPDSSTKDIHYCYGKIRKHKSNNSKKFERPEPRRTKSVSDVNASPSDLFGSPSPASKNERLYRSMSSMKCSITDGEEEEASLASPSHVFESPAIAGQDDRLYRSMPSLKCSIDILGNDSIKCKRKSTMTSSKDSRHDSGKTRAQNSKHRKKPERPEPRRAKSLSDVYGGTDNSAKQKSTKLSNACEKSQRMLAKGLRQKSSNAENRRKKPRSGNTDRQPRSGLTAHRVQASNEKRSDALTSSDVDATHSSTVREEKEFSMSSSSTLRRSSNHSANGDRQRHADRDGYQTPSSSKSICRRSRSTSRSKKEKKSKEKSRESVTKSFEDSRCSKKKTDSVESSRTLTDPDPLFGRCSSDYHSTRNTSTKLRIKKRRHSGDFLVSDSGIYRRRSSTKAAVLANDVSANN